MGFFCLKVQFIVPIAEHFYPYGILLLQNLQDGVSIFTGSNDEAFHLAAVPCSQFLSPFSTWVDDSLIFFSVTVDLLNITLGGSAQETIEYRTSVHEKKNKCTAGPRVVTSVFFFFT